MQEIKKNPGHRFKLTLVSPNFTQIFPVSEPYVNKLVHWPNYLRITVFQTLIKAREKSKKPEIKTIK